MKQANRSIPFQFGYELRHGTEGFTRGKCGIQRVFFSREAEGIYVSTGGWICCFSRVSRIEKYASRLMTSRRRTGFSLRSPLRRLIPCPVFRLPALFRPFSGLVQNRQVPFSCARRGKGSGMASLGFRIRSAAPPEVGGSAFQDSGNHRTNRFCRNNSRISGTRPPLPLS